MAEYGAIVVNENAPSLELSCLLENFRRSLKFWFLSPKTSIEIFVNACTDILIHGIVHLDVTMVMSEDKDVALQKFLSELEWVRKSMLIKDMDLVECAEETIKTATTKGSTNATRNFLQNWVLRNLEDKIMCASIETLIITEKELLQSNYSESAFLRKEPYAHAFIIGLSAYELNQYSLLSQIDKNLFSGDVTDSRKRTKHKRTTSHPNFSLSLVKANDSLKATQEEIIRDKKRDIDVPILETSKRNIVFPAFRKTKSLSVITMPSIEPQPLMIQTIRPRSKTLTNIKRSPMHDSERAPRTFQRDETCKITTKLNNLKYPYDDPYSTSANSCHSQTSNTTTSSATVNTFSSTSSASSSPIQHAKVPQRIEIINCDDIKIWTDQSVTPESTHTPNTLNNLNSYKTPSPMTIKKPKTISPVNSILSSLFPTPPTYSPWYTADSSEQTEQATAAVLCGSSADCNNSSFYNASVFDAFMPIYGQKMQPKKKSTLFEDELRMFDCKSAPKSYGCNSQDESPVKTSTSNTLSNIERTPASCQSLTAFLKMTQHSHNNTELEKENAHFRISEAIISAIEHIKWNNSQPSSSQRQSAALATDWLKKDEKHGETDKKLDFYLEQQEVVVADSDEYIPIVEHSESCLESLTAEVVGLSLISRFNDSHMPKVSELKWLVSDEDTPQQLLPLPDNSSANPDDHIFPPMTRGTKYWAPPRPQIIFTDHPTPNRKELIRKQNNRCAGCGMRVSLQNINSFRYCTYLGKYHCTGCHRNQMSSTPAKILQTWDFKCYPVSVFAYRLLEQMYTYPLFHVPDLNPALYIKSKHHLLEARNKRLKLKFVKDFIKACRFAKREQNYFDAIPGYITNDIDTWSLSDFIEARHETMQRSINELIEKCENHIFHCVLCSGRGFCCEYCLRDGVIYPWQNKVFRCDRCGSCFHMGCWKAMSEVCCRCQRIWNRENDIAESMSGK